MTQTPILFLGDSPSLQTGLARIGRDLSTRAATLPEFRVGYLGRGGLGSRKCPIAQYNFDESHGWGEGAIEQAWDDFAGDNPGIIFTIWDATRLGWFACPRAGQVAGRFLARFQGQRWGYFPVDSTNADGRLSIVERDTLKGYNRRLAYGEFGARVISQTVEEPTNWLPHGIDIDVFQPRDRQAARIAMNYKAADRVVGMVATNQARKDWATAVLVLAMNPRWKGWFHIDRLNHFWDLELLIHEFQVQDRVKITMTGSLNDVELSYYYSACDVTILPSYEGFGYSIAESLACGTPCLHSVYGGGFQLVEPLVSKYQHVAPKPETYRIDCVWNRKVPVFDPSTYSLEAPRPNAEECRASVEHLHWDRLWERCWKKWFLGGVEQW